RIYLQRCVYASPTWTSVLLYKSISALIIAGYVNSAEDTVLLHSDLSLNCVILSSSPIYVLDCIIHESSVCAGTSDCTNKVTFSGSSPAAIYKAARERVLFFNAFWSCGTVIAC